MARNAMRKNLRQSIIKSFGRYIAIVAIIALGSSLFVGLLMTKQDMVATGQQFMDQQNMFDLRFVSTYGWTQKQVDKAAQLEGVADAEGSYYQDVVTGREGAEEELVYRFYSIPQRINQVALRGGRMPEKPDECLADGFYCDDSILGTQVTVSVTNDEDTLDAMVFDTYTVVGYVATPLYMDMNRGTTSVGSGSLTGYYYIPWEGFDVDIYAQIDLTLEEDYPIYSEAYNALLEEMNNLLEPQAEQLGQERYDTLRLDAQRELTEGFYQYAEGFQAYRIAEFETWENLDEAREELEDAELKLKLSGEQLEDAADQLRAGESQLETARRELEAQQRLAEENLPAAKQGVEKAKGYLDSTASDIQTQTGYAPDALPGVIAGLETQIGALQPAVDAGTATPEQLAQHQQLTGTKANLETAYGSYTYVKGQYDYAVSVRDGMQHALDVDIPNGLGQIATQWDEIDEQWITITNAWAEINKGFDEIEEGWRVYEDGVKDAEKELADAKADLDEAFLDLEDAQEEIRDMEAVEVFVLDCTSNVGYNNLDSSSDIVAGVSRVIPVFFLLVASLVCITTMTRMIDEERTQIGTLKALGYSNRAIINKYMVYSGSGAVIGCGLGTVVGSLVFPQILWTAYGVMLYIQPTVVLEINWILCGIVVVVYTAVMLIVTWYSCHRTLEEEPAELIRPKSPDPGKKILMEYLPFWHRISFLNKVTIRNIFRYRQRLAMMMVGIGGCTALLVTGFGLRDSVMNVVDYQFQEVSIYDAMVYFNENQTERQQEDFLQEVDDRTDNVLFFHQSSVDLEFGGSTKEIYLICGSAEVANFIDMHSDGESIPMPGENEVVLSIGVCENLGISQGDSVMLRNADLETMELTVSGIYENHVYNYAILSPQTMVEQLGEPPEQQMAFLQIPDDQDVHALGADISELDGVMNVSISEDVAEMVGSMMEALNLVVIVIVFCAGLLAVIVLYNLTNININERIREIATIKVLGFRAGETGAYVFKENLTLTVAGSVFGLLLGYLLLLFVMSQIKIDMVWFKVLVEPVSYGISIVLTILSAIVVDFIFYFKLDKINMAEALKSVE